MSELPLYPKQVTAEKEVAFSRWEASQCSTKTQAIPALSQ